MHINWGMVPYVAGLVAICFGIIPYLWWLAEGSWKFRAWRIRRWYARHHRKNR